MASAFQRVIESLSKLEIAILNKLKHPFIGDLPVLVDAPCIHQPKKQQTLKQLLQSSVLWAVPKKRRTIEKRRNRRFGWPQYVYKILQPKTNILTCPKCGSYYEAGCLCATCYECIKQETTEMQEAIKNALGISPIENEVVVLYEDSPRNHEYLQGKRIVELKKKEPKIFSNNLLQRSTEVSSGKTEVTEIKDVK